jgi:DNA-binding transcriptional regulator WhiA
VIDRWGDWSGLSGQTRQIAEVRRENPDATLAELGEFVSPQLSKSAVNNHLRKLIKHAQELESDH